MNNNKIIRAPTLAKDGKVMMIVLNMTRRNLALVMSLNIRPILNALATVACLGPNVELVVYPMISVIYEMMTIKKSNMFHPLLK